MLTVIFGRAVIIVMNVMAVMAEMAVMSVMYVIAIFVFVYKLALVTVGFPNYFELIVRHERLISTLSLSK